MTTPSVLDATGRRRSPRPCPVSRRSPTAQQGHPLPRRPTEVDEIVAVMRPTVTALGYAR